MICRSNKKPEFSVIICIVVLSFHFGGQFCQSFQFYQQSIPNAEAVPDPCNPGKLWIGVGHKQPSGGGRLNQFGQDFIDNGYQWTPALCRKDSDGDGRSNGQELGDPNCLWKPGQKPTVTNPHLITHPGICQTVGTFRCANLNSWLPASCRIYLQTGKVPVKRDTSGYCSPMPLITVPRNGYIVTTPTEMIDGKFAPGSRYKMSCQHGFAMVGHGSISCQPNGQWSKSEMYCQRQNDNALPPSIDTTPLPLFTMPRTFTIASFTLPPTLPVFTPEFTCERPFVGSRARIATLAEEELYPVGTVLTIQCIAGFLPNQATMVCLPIGQWSTPYLVCLRLTTTSTTTTSTTTTTTTTLPVPTCSMPMTPDGAVMTSPPPAGYVYSLGTTVEFTCQPGLVLTGIQNWISCQGQGTWSPFQFACQSPARANCSAPQLSLNVQITAPTKPWYSEGDTLPLACMAGHMTGGGDQFGTATITCLAGGRWSGTNLRCERYCLPPDVPHYAAIVPFEDYYQIGEQFAYTCQSGFTIWGTIRCRSDGTWSNAAMTCQQRERGIVVQGGLVGDGVAGTCRAPKPPANAVQVASNSTFNTGDYVAYTCQPGWEVFGVMVCLSDGTWSGADFICSM